MTARRSTPGEMGVMITIGIGVAGALWALAWIATQAPKTRSAERDGQSHTAQNHGEGHSRPIEHNPNATPYEPRCNPAYSKDDDDLCQQRRMAKAAERAAHIALWQTVIGGVGAALVLPALIFSAISAWGAVKSVGVTRDTAKRQLRAYFTLHSGHIKVGHLPDGRWLLEWQVTLMNGGQTPAYDVTTRRDAELYQTSFKGRPMLDLDKLAITSKSITGAGTSIHVTWHTTLPEADARDFMTGAKDILIRGRVDYLDAFREEGRWFEFECHRGTPHGDHIWSLGPTETGYKGN